MLGAGQRQGGGVELAELEVGERGARRVGEDRRRRRSRPTGSWSAPIAPPLRPWPGSPPGRDRAIVRHDPEAARAVAPDRRRRGAFQHLDAARRRRPSRRAGRSGRDRSGFRPRGRSGARCGLPRARARGRPRCPRRTGPRFGPATGRPPARPRPASHRIEAAQPAARGQRVGGVALGRVAGLERRGEAALRPVARALVERLSRDEHGARARLGDPDRGVEAGGACADDDHVWLSGRSRRPAEYAYPSTGAAAASPLTLFYRHPSSYEHDTGAHPENAARIRAISDADRRRLARARGREAPAADSRAARSRSRPRPPRRDRGLLRGRRRDDRHGHGRLRGLVGGGAARVGRRVRRGRAAAARRGRAAFCALRPPGHHAERDRAMGFCLTNHVAAAAEHARARGCERVLILDWDVHHGNGTEDIFKASADVLYVSIHQSPLYPGTGDIDVHGRGRRRGLHGQPAGSRRRRRRALHRAGRARRGPRRPRSSSRGSSRSRRDTTPTAPIRSRRACVTEEGYRTMAATMAGVASELGRRSSSASRAATTRTRSPRRCWRRSRGSKAGSATSRAPTSLPSPTGRVATAGPSERRAA